MHRLRAANLNTAAPRVLPDFPGLYVRAGNLPRAGWHPTIPVDRVPPGSFEGDRYGSQAFFLEGGTSYQSAGLTSLRIEPGLTDTGIRAWEEHFTCNPHLTNSV